MSILFMCLLVQSNPVGTTTRVHLYRSIMSGCLVTQNITIAYYSARHAYIYDSGFVDVFTGQIHSQNNYKI